MKNYYYPTFADLPTNNHLSSQIIDGYKLFSLLSQYLPVRDYWAVVKARNKQLTYFLPSP